MSHDLRNPLAAIAGSSELLLSNLQSTEINLNEAVEFVSITQRNAALMERLIADLLDAERMAPGKVEVKQSKQSVDDLFGECKDLFGAIALKKSIFLKIATATGLFANIDRDRIMQVLSNLIGNALKHTPRGGTVSLEAHPNNGEIEIAITDTGPGIPLEEQSRIFEKFSQLGIDTRQGLGLGLYISKWIVEAHGGKIGVRSKPGHGSTFTFTVPVFSVR